MAVRNALLTYLRVNVSPLPLFQNPRAGVGGMPQLIRRHFSDEAKGSFLDKSEVTDRVLSVVKNFQKVDPSKVTPNAHFQNDLGLDSLDSVEIVMALEEEFGFEIPDNEADKINSINLAVDFIARRAFIDISPAIYLSRERCRRREPRNLCSHVLTGPETPPASSVVGGREVSEVPNFCRAVKSSGFQLFVRFPSQPSPANLRVAVRSPHNKLRQFFLSR
ncbi:Acyl carrier protein 2- mitochondrial [Striga hermonthica]|uniref:Acyl carrier protein n=1 Tax=Striga hermonthica TaxID=68872 RepID=A0A9N7RQX0_STRHE|nr:Acyl carrier protein 2- mitochondrial [Striga hermonthica]